MGLKIEKFLADSYASSIGMLEGDVLDSCNAVALNKKEELSELIQNNLGEDLVFVILRGNFAKEISAKGKPLGVEVVSVQSNASYAQNADELRSISAVKRSQYHSSIESDDSNRVIVTDVKMPFLSMVVFMVKWAIASIPAFIILFVLFRIVVSVISEMLQ